MIVHLLSTKNTKRFLVVLFIFAGLAASLFRWFEYGETPILAEDTAWKISLNGLFDVSRDETIIGSSKPKSGKYTKVISQRLYHPGLKLIPGKRTAPGQVLASARVSGKTEFLLEYHIQLSQSPILQLTEKATMTTTQRELYLSSTPEIDLTLHSLVDLNQYLRRDTSNSEALLHKVFRYTQKPLKELRPPFNEIKSIIKTNKATTLGRARLMVALCRLNNIPARLVTGFVLEEKPVTSPYYWLEVYDEEAGWQGYDPEKGYERALPNHYVAFQHDDAKLFSVENGKLLKAKYSISEELDILNVARLEQEESLLDIFNLQRLDLETRQTIKILLILPFCVLFTAFVRHVLGLFPYGTFTAPLLALAMVYAEMIVTLVVGGIVISIALLGRAVLPDSLTRAPRLSLIFTFVAMSMVLSVSILNYFSISGGHNIILLPTIILVSIVDRFYSYMDTTNAHAALIRLSVTIAIAIACIPFFEYEKLGTYIIAYPETHMITVALVLIFSSYRGLKLTDNKFLKLFGENKILRKSTRKNSEKNKNDNLKD